MTDKAIAWVRQQRSLMTDKPFFMYYAPGATHAPHQAPKEWADKYKGSSTPGWDVLRDEMIARQKQLGVIPDDAELTPRPDEILAWDDVADELKPSWPGRWRSTPASWSTPIITSDVSWTRSRNSACSTTR